MVGMIVINNNIRKIEHLYWLPDTECVEITGVHKLSSPPVIIRCRVGFDQIDSFMLNAKNCKEREAFDWHIDMDDYLSLSSSGRNYLWVLCLLVYYLMEKGIHDHPMTLKVQDELVSWALMQKESHPEFGVRALKHAITLGSTEAMTHLTSDDFSLYFPDEGLKTKTEMDLS